MRKNKFYYVKVIALIFFAFATFCVGGCYEGEVGSEGEPLKKYLAPAQLKDLIEKPDHSIWIIDVRPYSAYRQGHIPTARSFPSSEILSRLKELPKDKYLILYCETGGRSHGVMKELEKNGYARTMNWGGVSRWPFELIQGSP